MGSVGSNILTIQEILSQTLKRLLVYVVPRVSYTMGREIILLVPL